MAVFNKKRYSLAMANLHTLRLAEGFVKKIEAGTLPVQSLETIRHILYYSRVNGGVLNTSWDERYAKLEEISKELDSQWGIIFKKGVSDRLSEGISSEEMARFLATSVSSGLSSHLQRVVIICYILTSRRLLSLPDKSTPGCANTRSTSVSGG